MSRLSFANRTVVVTGAASGLGRALARRLAGVEKAHLVLADCQADRLETLRTEIEAAHSSRVRTITVDLGSAGGAKILFEKATAEGDVFALVNNAGLSFYGKTLDRPFEEYRELIQVNCLTVFETTAAFLRFFLDKGEGAILNVTSLGGLISLPYQNVYAATKHAVQSFSEGLRAEYGRKGITICTYAPGGIATEMIARSGLDRHFRMDSRLLMRPERAAELALRSFKREKLVCIPGALNKMAVLAQRITTKKHALRTTRKIYEPKNR
jgi:hypothetical protein